MNGGSTRAELKWREGWDLPQQPHHGAGAVLGPDAPEAVLLHFCVCDFASFWRKRWTQLLGETFGIVPHGGGWRKMALQSGAQKATVGH